MPVDFSPLVNSQPNLLRMLDDIQAQKRAEDMQKMTAYQFLRQKQEDERNDKLRGAYVIDESGAFNPKATFANLLQIDPKSAMEFNAAMEKQSQDALKRQQDQETFKLGKAEKVYNLMKQSTGYIMANPTLANATRELTRFGNMTGADISGEMEALQQLGDNPEAIKQWAAGHSLTADQLLPKFQSQDIGGSINALSIDPLTGKPTVISTTPKTATPDALMTDRRAREEGALNRGVTMRGQNMTDARAREQMNAKQPNEKISPQQQKINDATDVVSLLQQAAPLINKATGSGLGSLIDKGQAFFGSSNEGAQYAAQLKAIEGMLISKMPKMSGPQSDKDVLLYKQMAGQIGDSSVPPEQKQAAMNAINEINSRYLGSPPAKLNFGDNQQAKTAKKTPLAKVKNDADYNRLPKGTRFIAPDGTTRVKQ